MVTVAGYDPKELSTVSERLGEIEKKEGSLLLLQSCDECLDFSTG